MLGLKGKNKIESLVEFLRDLNKNLNIPQAIKNYNKDGLPDKKGFVPEDIFLKRLPEIAKNAIADACTGSNPR